MKRWLILIALFIGLPMFAHAASIENGDDEVHRIKGRANGKDWVYVEVNPNGTKYFNCRYGCELILEKTGSSVELETDADVYIRNGILSIE